MILDWHKTELIPLLCPPQNTTPVTPKTILNWQPEFRQASGTEISPRDGSGDVLPISQRGKLRHRGGVKSGSGQGWMGLGTTWDCPCPWKGLECTRFKFPSTQTRVEFWDCGAVLSPRCSTLIPAPFHSAWQGMDTPSLCLRFFWYLAERACKAQAKNKGSNKSLLLVNYSVSHYCLKTP